jgi:uncharacterized protein YrrD
MLLNVSSLMNARVDANDGDVGKVVDIFFDDQRWAARYMVVETGGWLKSKRVLVSPASLIRAKGEIGVVHANLSREQIRHCPDVDIDKPVSRHYEIAHAKHYGYPGYWDGLQLWGPMAYPGAVGVACLPHATITPETQREKVDRELKEAEQSHLRSCKEILGYRVGARDGDAGDVDDLAIDDETWAIHYMVVDTKRWWPGGQVLIASSAVEALNHDGKVVKVHMARDAARAGVAAD